MTNRKICKICGNIAMCHKCVMNDERWTDKDYDEYIKLTIVDGHTPEEAILLINKSIEKKSTTIKVSMNMKSDEELIFKQKTTM